MDSSRKYLVEFAEASTPTKDINVILVIVLALGLVFIGDCIMNLSTKLNDAIRKVS